MPFGVFSLLHPLSPSTTEWLNGAGKQKTNENEKKEKRGKKFRVNFESSKFLDISITKQVLQVYRLPFLFLFFCHHSLKFLLTFN